MIGAAAFMISGMRLMSCSEFVVTHSDRDSSITKCESNVSLSGFESFVVSGDINPGASLEFQHVPLRKRDTAVSLEKVSQADDTAVDELRDLSSALQQREKPQPQQQPQRDVPLLKRVAAEIIDHAAVMLSMQLLRATVRTDALPVDIHQFAVLPLVMLRDALGLSLGNRLLGLEVVRSAADHNSSIAASALRNLPQALFLFSLSLHNPDDEADRRRGRALILAELCVAGADVLAGWLYSSRRARLCDLLAGTTVQEQHGSDADSAALGILPSLVHSQHAQAFKHVVQQWSSRSRLQLNVAGGGWMPQVAEEAAWFDGGRED